MDDNICLIAIRGVGFCPNSERPSKLVVVRLMNELGIPVLMKDLGDARINFEQCVHEWVQPNIGPGVYYRCVKFIPYKTREDQSYQGQVRNTFLAANILATVLFDDEKLCGSDKPECLFFQYNSETLTSWRPDDATIHYSSNIATIPCCEEDSNKYNSFCCGITAGIGTDSACLEGDVVGKKTFIWARKDKHDMVNNQDMEAGADRYPNRQYWGAGSLS